MHGKDDDGQSHWAVLTDQTGAAFGVIPVVSDDPNTGHHGERVGRISWLSLTVAEPPSSRDFYEKVIGWGSKNASTDGNLERFEMLIDNETEAAEINRSDSGDDTIPAVWMIHLPVGDFDRSLDLVTEKGVSVIKK